VGVVTSITPVIVDNGMKLTDLGWVIVAFGAQRHTFPEKQRLVLRGVRIVTIHTSSVSGCLVGYRFFGGIVVALDTKLTHR